MHQTNLFMCFIIIYDVFSQNKSQHGCVRWVVREHLTPLCHDFACNNVSAGMEWTFHSCRNGMTTPFLPKHLLILQAKS